MISGTSYLSRAISLAALLFLPFIAGAQQSTLDVPDSLVKKDSIQTIKMLIVPFNPNMYFSDADKDIGEVSKVDQNQVRNKVSASLESSVSSYLDLYYDVEGLSKQTDGRDDLDLIFGSISYSPQEIETPKEEKKSGLKGLREKVKTKQVEAPEEQKDPESYMDIEFADSRLIDYLSSKYGVDYVIFFNQFEIKTDYENCIDLQMRNYYREIKVHYSVVGKDGKKISGDVITIPYNSNENNLQVIVKENFGQISQMLFNRIYLQK